MLEQYFLAIPLFTMSVSARGFMFQVFEECFFFIFEPLLLAI